MAIVEAASAGLLVVSTRVGGVPEVGWVGQHLSCGGAVRACRWMSNETAWVTQFMPPHCIRQPTCHPIHPVTHPSLTPPNQSQPIWPPHHHHPKVLPPDMLLLCDPSAKGLLGALEETLERVTDSGRNPQAQHERVSVGRGLVLRCAVWLSCKQASNQSNPLCPTT